MSGKSLSFEPASSEDAEQLVALRIAAMRPSLERLGRFDPQRARDRFLASFEPTHTRHLVVDGQRVGFVVVRPQAGHLLLDHLYVAPEHQGEGIGAAALAVIFDQADARKMPVRVGALRESDSNRFYARHGFELVEETELDNYYVRGPKELDQMRLVWPSSEYLSSYVAALECGWSPNNLRPEVTHEELLQIQADSVGFLSSLVDREAKGPPVKLPDGSTVPRLPGYRRWLWDGEFCGSIGLRWQLGTNALPDYCLGHIGYSVVPWKSGKGYAKQALRSLLSDAPAEGLTFVEITTSPDNLASRRVIQANGGVLIEEFIKAPGLGGTPELRFRIELKSSPAKGH